MSVESELNKFAKEVIKQARTNLTKKDRNVSKELYNSLKSEVKINKNSFELSFYMKDYGKFQDKGVKGKEGTPKGAQNSPFRFGSGKSGNKGGLTEAINKWVKARRFQFRDKKGKFMSYDSTAFLISRSIYRKGIPASFFYSQPFKLGFQKLPSEIVEAFRLTEDDLKAFTRK